MHKTRESTKWHVSQIKGSIVDDFSDGDNFTCVEFNESGELLATGDKSGRITVYRTDLYDIYCAFTSHEPEFDYLKSLEIEEKINSIKWLPNYTSAHHLLSANDKTVKLWRISERDVEAYNFNIQTNDDIDFWSSPNVDPDLIGPPIPHIISSNQLRVPKFRPASRLTVETRPRRVFANAHTYHINAVSLNSDQETFLSADDLRINLWHLNVSNPSFTIVDLKPSNMEDLSEVITCARFHPTQCHLLAYSTSRGVIRLCDMRQGALCDNHVMVYEDPSLSQNLGFFADIIASLSDFRFGYTGNYLLARDYLTLKVWDNRMGDRPCEIYSVHEPFRSHLCMLYENDAIFDKFLCAWSNDDRHALTGSYGNLFHIFDRHTGLDWLYDLTDPGAMCPPSTNPYEVFPFSLTPKRFVAPEDPLGGQLGLSSISVAPLDVVESFLSEMTSQTSSHSSCSDTNNDLDKSDNSQDLFTLDSNSNSVIPTTPAYLDTTEIISSPPTGSKRRKQVLPSCSNDLDDSTNHIQNDSEPYRSRAHKSKHRQRNKQQSLSQESVENDLNLNQSVGEYLQMSASFESKRIHFDDFASGKISLPGLHDLDCQRKLLHLSWHPTKMLTVAVSGNQLFLVSGEPHVTCPSPSHNQGKLMNDEDNINSNDCIPIQSTSEGNVPDPNVNSSPVDLGSNKLVIIDVKAAKRRRRRHYISDESESDILLPGMPGENDDSSDMLDINTTNVDALSLLDSPLPSKMDYTNYEADREDNGEDRVTESPLQISPNSNLDKVLCIDSLFPLASENLSASDSSIS